MNPCFLSAVILLPDPPAGGYAVLCVFRKNSGVYALAVASSFQLVVRAGERFKQFIF